MGAAKSGKPGRGVGKGLVNYIEKAGLSGFGFSGHSGRLRLAGRRRLPVEKCDSQDQKMAAGCILNRTWESKMEIPG
jgi:hypothetical protein